MKSIERFVVAAAVVLLIGTLALGNVRSSRTPAPAARLRPEQIATMPARIQAQLAGTASVTATQPHPATASVRRLRPEQVMTLPARIQAQVAGTAVQPARRSHRKTSWRCRRRSRTRCAARWVSLQRQPTIRLPAPRRTQVFAVNHQESTVIGNDPGSSEASDPIRGDHHNSQTRTFVWGAQSRALEHGCLHTQRYTDWQHSCRSGAFTRATHRRGIFASTGHHGASCTSLEAPVNVQPANEQAARHGLRPDAPLYGVHGPHAVGARDVVVTEGDHSVAMTIWYPALNPTNAEEAIGYQIAEDIGSVPPLPAEARTLTGRALQAAAPDTAQGPYPLVLYTPGLAGFRQQSAFLTEHLASYGFVVISPDPRGETFEGVLGRCGNSHARHQRHDYLCPTS